MLDKSATVAAEFVPKSVRTSQRPGKWSGKLTGGMLAQAKNTGGALWSPDNRYLYYSVDFNGRADIYRQDLESGATIQISSDVEAPALLRIAQGGMDISPDGTKLVYLSGKDGKLYIINSGGGVAQRLSEGEGSQTGAAYSPDGRNVAYVAAYGEKQLVAVVASEPESWPRRVSRSDAFATAPQWLPDGKRLVYTEYDAHGMYWSESRLVITDIESGESRVLRDGWGKGVFYTGYSPSPDGRWLAYLSDESGWNNIYLLDLATGQSKPLGSANAEFSEINWSPDGSKVAYLVNENCNVGLRMTTLEGQTFSLDEGEFVCSGLAWSKDGTRIAYLKQSPTEPPNLWLYNLNKSQKQQITWNAIGGLSEAGLVKAEQVRWTSPDGLEIEGLLFKPENIQPGQHPLLLHVHGGPIAQYNRRWDSSVQYWVNRGWVVVEPNFRGSTGYGRDFRNKLLGTWGQEDMLDNLGGIDFAASQGLIDTSRVVAWGGSGGGYATMMLLTKWAERFKAGVALVGVSNFVSFPEQTDRLARYLIDDLLGVRHENFALHEERSPVYFAHQIKAPLMIIMGAEDRRVPAKQGEEMVEALKKAGKTDFEYISYEGEGHGWRKSQNIADYLTRMGTFLDKWVLER